jgi:myo-inositol 2-dehydrogenase/D-chiro-inositol 1-dehydrogenase
MPFLSQVPPFEKLQDAISALSSDIPLDGILVSSPTFMHAQVVREAAKNRLHVFVEKPVDETADKIRSLFTEAKAANIELCCGFQRRFDLSYKKAAESVWGGAVGRPVMASIFFADHPVPPKAFLLAGGNIFMDLAAHDVDFITNALYDKVVSVYASGSSSSEDLAKAGVHDNATVVMNFSKGEEYAMFYYVMPFSFGISLFILSYNITKRRGCYTLHESFGILWLRSTM